MIPSGISDGILLHINISNLLILGVYNSSQKIPKIQQILDCGQHYLYTYYPLQVLSLNIRMSSEKINVKQKRSHHYLKINQGYCLFICVQNHEKTIYKERSCPIFFHRLEAQSKQLERVPRHSVRLFHNF